MTRTRRTPAQIAADLAEKAASAQIRADIANATSDPILAPVADALKAAKAHLNQLKRSLVDTNPNSFVNRRRAFQLRLEEIDAAETLAMAQLSDAEYPVGVIKDDLGDLASGIADGNVVADIIPGIVAGYSMPKHETLELNYELAHRARKEYKGNIVADAASIAPQEDTQNEMTAGA